MSIKMPPKKIADHLIGAWNTGQRNAATAGHWGIVEHISDLLLPGSKILVSQTRQKKQAQSRQQKIRVIEYLQKNPAIARQVLARVPDRQLQMVIVNLLKRNRMQKKNSVPVLKQRILALPASLRRSA